MPYLTRRGVPSRAERSSFLRNSSLGTIASTPRPRISSCSATSRIGLGLSLAPFPRPGTARRSRMRRRVDERTTILGRRRVSGKVAARTDRWAGNMEGARPARYGYASRDGLRHAASRPAAPGDVLGLAPVALVLRDDRRDGRRLGLGH